MRRFSDIADAVIFSRGKSADTPQRIDEEILARTERDGDISTVTAIFRNAGTVYYSEEEKFFTFMNDKGYRDWEELFANESAENITAMIYILFEAGISLGENCVTPLALHNMNPKILRAFINYGWNVNSRDEDGMTPLMHIMLSYLSADCVKVLVEAGADVNARDKIGYTPLMYIDYCYVKSVRKC